jgi:hypothetical protein
MVSSWNEALPWDKLRHCIEFVLLDSAVVVTGDLEKALQVVFDLLAALELEEGGGRGTTSGDASPVRSAVRGGNSSPMRRDRGLALKTVTMETFVKMLAPKQVPVVLVVVCGQHVCGGGGSWVSVVVGVGVGVSVGERSVKSYGICKCSTDEVLHSRSGRR